MIPFGILAGYFYIEKIKTEFRVLDLSADSFTFRLASPFEGEKKPEHFELHFYHRAENQYHLVMLEPDEYNLLADDDGKAENSIADYAEGNAAGNEAEMDGDIAAAGFCSNYRVITESALFLQEADYLMKDYLRYIGLKMAGNDAELSHQLIGYPAALEGVYTPNWGQQKQQMLEKLQPDPEWEKIWNRIPETGFILDQPSLYRQYLEMPEQAFTDWFYRENFLQNHPLSKRKTDVIAIGNQFCPQLLPDKHTMPALLRKIIKQGKKPLLLLPPLSERDQRPILDQMFNALKEVYSVIAQPKAAESESVRAKNVKAENVKAGRMKSENPEIVINDIGTLRLLAIEGNRGLTYSLTAGSLLNKRRRDVRLKYKTDIRNEGNHLLQENSWNFENYTGYMQQYDLTGLLEDACGYSLQLPACNTVKTTLITPFYQMNTSGYCTLYAACRNGARGKQTPVTDCPHYCEKKVFLYPEMLGMTGRYNSLFGFDSRILTDSRYLEGYQKQGLERILLRLL